MRETLARGAILTSIAGLVAGTALAVASLGYPAVAAADELADGNDEIATAIFEGEEIPADEVWEVASACVVRDDGVMECYRTTEEREEEADDLNSMEDSEAGTMSSCPVRLYSSTFYGGSELTLNTRLMWHNLSNYGFNNATSSYKISGCSATFRSGSNGSGYTYPGSTYEWAWCSSMSSGWNNRVSSVWIH